jgi:hypothetical protein
LLAAELLFVSRSLGTWASGGPERCAVIAIMLVIVALGMTIDRLVSADEARAERWGWGRPRRKPVLRSCISGPFMNPDGTRTVGPRCAQGSAIAAGRRLFTFFRRRTAAMESA